MDRYVYVTRERRKRKRQRECWLGCVPKPAAKNTEKINEKKKDLLARAFS